MPFALLRGLLDITFRKRCVHIGTYCVYLKCVGDMLCYEQIYMIFVCAQDIPLMIARYALS
jgi:hypothetical protein